MQTDYQGSETDRAQDTLAIRASLNRMVEAWDDGDAAKFAAEFSAEATYVIFVGLVYEGRAEIEEGHVPVLEKWQKGTRMSQHVRSIRFLGDDVATVLSEGGIGKRRVRHDKIQTYVFRRDFEGRWACESFQNTKMNRLFIRINALSTRRTRRS